MSKQARMVATAVVILASVGYLIAVVVIYLVQGSPRDQLVTLATAAAFYTPHFVILAATLRGRRPRWAPVVLGFEVLAAYLPDLWLVYGWAAGAVPLLAGPVLLLIPLRWSIPLVGLMAGWQGYRVFSLVGDFGSAAYYGLTVVITGGMIYALVRLVQVATELEAARADLAEAAVLKERLRISRDLHDGLGRSLTAIALKGDLASRLMDRDPAAARTEVGELVQVAREAAQDVRQVARGYREMTLAGEIHRAVALLESSGVICQVNLAAATLPRTSDEALAWAVREGVTNVLRHSAATTCTISTSIKDGAVHLEVVNDAAHPGGPSLGSELGSALGSGGRVHGGPGDVTVLGARGIQLGGGLAGLDERAAHAGGAVQATTTPSGGFLLVVKVPA